MDTPLLITKLRTPPVRPELVPRPRLIERLNAGLELDNRFVRKLTLVCAPAGFGKTTLISSWLTGQHYAYAWLSLDEGDNDPARFLTYVLAALRTVDATLGQAAAAVLHGPQPAPAEMLLTVLLNDIAARPVPFLLVLDDYHCIQMLPIHQQLAFLLEHLPPQMHLVIATREELPLPLSRLRSRGQVADIRQADLIFTPEEATDFMLRTMHLHLSSADVTALYQHTEGWIAGLQLAALSLQASDDVPRSVQSFTGSQRYILDYLMDEVFQRQAPEIRDFLLRTCILERFNASLCDVLTGRQDSDRVLRTLEDANLFIIPLDESRQWYRYHQLFADLLRHRLDLEKQYDPVLLHRRASEWFADSGLAAEAVHHALVAADWPRAAALIAPLADTLLKQGQTATLLRWFRMLPETAVCADPRLCLNFAWVLILTEQFSAAEPYLARVEQAAAQSGARFVLGQVLIARAYIGRARGDHDRVIELSERALELVPPGEDAARSVLLANLGMAQFYRGRLGKAAQALSAAEEAGRTSGNQYARWTAAIFLNRIGMAQGKLRQAAETARQIVREGGQLPIVALAHYDLSRIYLEWNDWAAAADCVARGIDLARRGGGVEFTAAGQLIWALIRVAQRELTAAQTAVQEADRMLEHPGISPSTRLYSLVCHIGVALAQNDLQSATRAAERSPAFASAGSVGDYLSLMLARAQLALAQGRRVLAAEQLAALRATALQKGFHYVATQACALQALAAPNRTEGQAFLAQALAEAEPEGYVRTFVAPGESMAVLLRAAVACGNAVPYVDHLLAALGISAPEPPPPVPSELVEPLSDRELQVLRLLAEGQTNQEIARRLYMSVNTVKTHLKNIYGKLGAKNRARAGARARELGLIP